MADLTGKVALVTGGTGGVGLWLARHLAKSCKARLVLVGRSAPSAATQARLRELEADGAEVELLVGVEHQHRPGRAEGDVERDDGEGEGAHGGVAPGPAQPLADVAAHV